MAKKTAIKKLPAVRDLVAAVTSKRIDAASSFLLSRRPVLQKYPSFDDLAYGLAADPMPDELQGLNQNIQVLRDRILAELRRNSIFIGLSVVEELVFEVFRNSVLGRSPL